MMQPIPPFPAPAHPSPIRPQQVWMTLTSQQQATILQVLVTMCQDCLLLPKEVSYDNTASLPENHANPS